MNAPGALDGFTLISPLRSKRAYLLGMDGVAVHVWTTNHLPSGAAHLLSDGRLLRACVPDRNPRFHGGGIGGRIEELGWDDRILWSYELATDERTLHHDVVPMPNGNVLAIAWERASPEEALRRGRAADCVGAEGLWFDRILEIRPTRPSGGEIVWSWSALDHLVQDTDARLPCHGSPAEHPERIDVNADHRFEARLSGGSFRFAMSKQEVPLRELCDVALRHNSRRRFLFVSKVLGRHWPVRPAALSEVARRLAEKLALKLKEGPVIFIGMAETATTLGQAVFREWLALGGSGLYIESTRRRTGGPLAFEFAEAHSHATAHAVHLPSAQEDPHGWFQTAVQAVIVDDEATTALTAAALAEQFRLWRGGDGSLAVTLAVLLSWHSPSAAKPHGLAGIESLAEGAFEFHTQAELSTPPVVQHTLDMQVTARRGVRHGTICQEMLPGHWQATARHGERVLVIGQGEYGFQPLLLAEWLEQQGASAWVQATTRSPILIGGAIQHVRRFPALSGEGHDEHLYNVPQDHGYDRVLLCLEDTQPAQDHPIWQVPGLEVLP